MIVDIWNTIFYEPLYNALVFIIDTVPGIDVGVAVIILTIIVKLILSPLSKKSVHSQARLRELEPELKEIKETYADDKQKQAEKTFEIYKENKVNPFSGCLLLLLQLPVIIALYFVFLKGLDFNPELLYSFVDHPQEINMQFLGLIDIGGKSIVLAILAGLSQFLHTRFSKTMPATSSMQGGGMKEQFMKGMNMQMKYILPIFIAFIAYQISAAVALYWVTSNVFSMAQEYLIRRTGPQAVRGTDADSS